MIALRHLPDTLAGIQRLAPLHGPASALSALPLCRAEVDGRLCLRAARVEPTAVGLLRCTAGHELLFRKGQRMGAEHGDAEDAERAARRRRWRARSRPSLHARDVDPCGCAVGRPCRACRAVDRRSLAAARASVPAGVQLELTGEGQVRLLPAVEPLAAE